MGIRRYGRGGVADPRDQLTQAYDDAPLDAQVCIRKVLDWLDPRAPGTISTHGLSILNERMDAFLSNGLLMFVFGPNPKCRNVYV